MTQRDEVALLEATAPLALAALDVRGRAVRLAHRRSSEAGERPQEGPSAHRRMEFGSCDPFEARAPDRNFAGTWHPPARVDSQSHASHSEGSDRGST